MSLLVRFQRFAIVTVLASLCTQVLLDHGLAQTDNGKKYALLIGVNEYDSSNLRALQFSENDVEELANLLRKPSAGFSEVRVLTNTRGGKARPTGAIIRSELREMLKDKTRRDMVLLALSGHGVQLDVKDPYGKGEPKTYTFFCPANADLNDVNYHSGHSRTMLNLDDLFKQFGDSNPGKKMVLIDACRNEMTVKGSRKSLADGRVTVPEGVLALFSCGKRQVSWESRDLKHGVFFHYVLEGLRGKAKNGDGEVTWWSLSDYATRQVTRNVARLVGGGARQTPAFVGSDEGESPLLVRLSNSRARETGRPVVKKAGIDFAGVYRGDFTFSDSPDSVEYPNQKGTMTLRILGTGEVRGEGTNSTFYDFRYNVTGSVDKDGKMKVIYHYPAQRSGSVTMRGTTFTAEGTLTKSKEGKLKGTLTEYKQNDRIGSINLDLSAK